MLAVVGPLVGLMLVLGSAGSAAAVPDRGRWLSAITERYVIVDRATGDLDGDGKEETLICYRDARRPEPLSGVAVLSGTAPNLLPVFHVQLDKILCEKVRVSDKKLGILLAGKRQLVWSYGEEIRFRADAGSLSSATIKTASSTNGPHKVEKLLDGDLDTSWSEGAEGTGIGQSVTLKLPKPTDIGVVGVFSGNFESQRAFFDHNRLHRASVEAKTEADMGDSAAGIDFSSLGIEAIGDRAEFKFENKPQLTYVNINRKGVVQLQLRVESVYLGDKKDDTHIAEIEIVPLLGLSETVDRATSVSSTRKDGAALKEPESAAASSKVKELEKARAEREAAEPSAAQEAIDKLDANGPALVGDDL